MYNGRREIWRWTPFSSKVMGNESLSRKSGPAAYFRLVRLLASEPVFR